MRAAVRSAPVAFETRPDGRGGTITIIAHEALAVRHGSRIFSDTFGQGDGGSVVIEAGRLQLVTGAGSPLFSTVSASTFGGGDAGSLTIQAGKIVVDNSFISAGVGTASTAAAAISNSLPTESFFATQDSSRPAHSAAAPAAASRSERQRTSRSLAGRWSGH